LILVETCCGNSTEKVWRSWNQRYS